MTVANGMVEMERHSSVYLPLGAPTTGNEASYAMVGRVINSTK
jgi:hypothetical protein